MPSLATPFKPPRMRTVARQAMIAHLEKVPVGSRLPPLDELARELGVGRCNLQEAMRELAREGVVVSRPKLGTFVARSPAGVVARKGRRLEMHSPSVPVLTGKRVVLITGDYTEPLQMAMVRGAREVLGGAGAQLSEVSTDFLPDSDIATDKVDLRIVLNPPLLYAPSLAGDTPVVVASTAWHESFMERMPGDMIGVDQFGGAAMAGELLRREGFTEACFLGVRDRNRPLVWEPISALRLAGFTAGFGAALSEANHVGGRGYSLNGGGSGFRRYMELAHRPKAIFAACDEMAVGFIIAAEAQGMLPGRDFHMIGFDGHRLGKQIHGGPLTTVAVPVEAMGRMAAEVAIQRLLNPKRPTQITYLTCELCRGGTVAPAKRLDDQQALSGE